MKSNVFYPQRNGFVEYIFDNDPKDLEWIQNKIEKLEKMISEIQDPRTQSYLRYKNDLQDLLKYFKQKKQVLLNKH